MNQALTGRLSVIPRRRPIQPRKRTRLFLRNNRVDFLIRPLFLFLLAGGLLLGGVRLALSAANAIWIGAMLFAALIAYTLLLKWAAQRYFIGHSQNKLDVERTGDQSLQL